MFQFKRGLFSRELSPVMKVKEPKRVMLVIAHPDDEAMFFGPTLCSLDPLNTFVLCLSNGNADGLGSIRELELIQSCAHFGICPDSGSSDVHSPSCVRVINDNRLPDSMVIRWDPDVVKAHVLEQIKLWDIDAVITFDEHGVSGHVNHIDTYAGVVAALNSLDSAEPHCASSSSDVCTAYKLVSVSVFRKFSGLLELLLSAYLLVWYEWLVLIMCSYIPPSGHTWNTVTPGSDVRGKCIRAYITLGLPGKPSTAVESESPGGALISQPLLSFTDIYTAMKCHNSQLVWYRRIFIIISSYSYINTLRPIDRTTERDQGAVSGRGVHWMDWLFSLSAASVLAIFKRTKHKSNT